MSERKHAVASLVARGKGIRNLKSRACVITRSIFFTRQLHKIRNGYAGAWDGSVLRS